MQCRQHNVNVVAIFDTTEAYTILGINSTTGDHRKPDFAAWLFDDILQ